MHLVVIGGTGFVGRHFIAAAVAKGHKITVVTRRASIDSELGDVAFLRGGTQALAASPEMLGSADCICHFASTTTPASSMRDPVADIQSNLIETVQLFEAMRHSGNRRILFLSSGGAVYGIPKYLPIDEAHPLNPISPYGVVKASVEHYLRMYETTHDFHPTIVRLANPYGPGQNSAGKLGAANTFVRLALSGEPATIWGDGSVVRDYVYISDAIELLIAAVEAKARGTYNCGTGLGVSLLDLISLVEDATGRQLQCRFEPARSYDPPQVVLDISHSTRTFGWIPRVPFQLGLKLTADRDQN